MRIGFIGTGNFARQHAEVLKEMNIEIAACYGTNTEKTALFSRDFHCKFYNHPLHLISRDIIDALYIVVPPFAHDGHMELKAIEQNIPFLCEKPVGLDITLCKKISREIEINNIITSSEYLLRYEPLFEEIKKIISRNKISTVRVCSYSYMPEVHWWRREKLSGGMMIEAGSHYVDLLRYFFGEISYAAAVSSNGFAKNNISDCDIDDSMEAILKFKSGIIASIGMTHLLNKINARQDEMQIFGQDFALKVDLYRLRYKNEAMALYKEAHQVEWQRISNITSKKKLLKSESTAFINAIQQSSHSFIKSTYSDAVKSLEVSSAMNQSAKFNQFKTI